MKKSYEELESRRKALQVEQQELQNLRNSHSRHIGKTRAAGEDIAPLLTEVAELGSTLKKVQGDLVVVHQELREWSNRNDDNA